MTSDLGLLIRLSKVSYCQVLGTHRPGVAWFASPWVGTRNHWSHLFLFFCFCLFVFQILLVLADTRGAEEGKGDPAGCIPRAPPLALPRSIMDQLRTPYRSSEGRGWGWGPRQRAPSLDIRALRSMDREGQPPVPQLAAAHHFPFCHPFNKPYGLTLLPFKVCNKLCALRLDMEKWIIGQPCFQPLSLSCRAPGAWHTGHSLRCCLGTGR